MAKIVITVFHGKDDPELVHIPFVVGNTALSSGHEVIIWLQGPSVNLCRIGYTEGVVFPPYTPIRQLIEEFIAHGGKIYLLDACMKSHQIKYPDYISDAIPAGPERLIQESLDAIVFNY